MGKCLIVGGGFAGLSAAIALCHRGWAVDLVELREDGAAEGVGIGLGGPALRALCSLGVVESVLREGFGFDGTEIRTAGGDLMACLPTPRLAGPAMHAAAGIMRSALLQILGDAARAAGVVLRMGCSFTSLTQDDEGVQVLFTDGSRSRYALVIGADGIYSKVRAVAFPGAPAPRYCGQGVWRAAMARLPQVQRIAMWMGPTVKAGVCPVSDRMMYLFLTENRPVNHRVAPDQWTALLSALLEPFDAPVVRHMRAQLQENASINYRPLETLLIPPPWHRGRVVLIGDAVHATTPHLASGACIAIEDAVVLAEELGRAAGTGGDLTQALSAFVARRWQRCRMVVENSSRLCDIEIERGSSDEHGRVTRESLLALEHPI